MAEQSSAASRSRSFYDRLGIDQEVQPGSDKLIEVNASSPGAFTYICTVPGHEKMKGTLEGRA